MRIMITGAAGFIGGALARRLLSEGHRVTGVVRDAARAGALAEAGVQVVHANLGDPNALLAAARDAELIFHCAGSRSHRCDPELLAWTHVAGAENLLAAARHAGVGRIVYLSCADATLLNRDRLNWKETQGMATRPLDACARTRLLGEELARHGSGGGLQVVALRPALVWGPGDTSLLPTLCGEALRGGMRLRGGGDNLWSTIYIDNLLDALWLAAQREGVSGEVFHVADDEAVTCREFLALLSTSLGAPGPRRGIYALDYALGLAREKLALAGPGRADVALRGRATLLDVQGAVARLGHRPRVNMAEGMVATAEWVRRMGGLAGVARLARSPDEDAELSAMRALADAG